VDAEPGTTQKATQREADDCQSAFLIKKETGYGKSETKEENETVQPMKKGMGEAVNLGPTARGLE